MAGKPTYEELEQKVKELTKEAYELRQVEKELQESEEDLRTSHKTFETVLDHLDGIVHASDLETYEVVFANKYTKDIFGDVIGKLCWQTIQQDQTGPCPFCKNDKLLNNDGSPTGVHIWENHNTLTNRWYEVRACASQWVDGRMVRLSIATDITQRRQTEETLKTREKELKIKTDNLEEANTALRVLLRRGDEAKIELEEKVLSNVKDLVVPFLEKLARSGLNESQKAYLSILKSNLNDIISPFSRTLSHKFLNLTPAEVQVANLIKEGKTTKEIAKFLNVSTTTIDSHRRNIRKKIGIKKKKANLRTHLLSIQE
ncbi:MAG: PAS domain-containing protein [Deltaproteobacteria bacterium]|nr:PAS domain-containing protein [Deltaproteobacteria bacterium]MBW1737426.1 PAS domain-containing protein [Deltaproteobacteria bacterium]MBW1910557.1 PAS domain-containing protein [Deltaproteobacteria bacterium]MBW2034593.1 PAS domain-containing protein [Deltaproteobacteria bacterium]MBW2114967.1 PAS domain-containing protein [Deltaproteobacteria bacterium]